MIGATRYELERANVGLQLSSWYLLFTAGYWDCLKRNLNAFESSEHPIKAFRLEHRLPRQDLFMAYNRILRML